MEEEGIVSVWIGEAQSAADFGGATAVSFSEGGDFLGSEFSRAFQIGYYDGGLTEAEYRGSPCNSIRELLGEVSYARQILPQLEKYPFRGAPNCFVLLYDYRFSRAGAFQGDGINLGFLGTATYKAD